MRTGSLYETIRGLRATYPHKLAHFIQFQLTDADIPLERLLMISYATVMNIPWKNLHLAE